MLKHEKKNRPIMFSPLLHKPIRLPESIDPGLGDPGLFVRRYHPLLGSTKISATVRELENDPRAVLIDDQLVCRNKGFIQIYRRHRPCCATRKSFLFKNRCANKRRQRLNDPDRAEPSIVIVQVLG